MAAGSSGPVCLAVSGGSDSLSLLHFTSAWAKSRGRALLVLTVDHGLRLEARKETAFVAQRAASLGHSAQILTWQGDRSGQNAARQARHGLLAGAARAAGAQSLLLGHTRSDVEETLLMRLARPGRLASACGPQPVSVSPVWPDGRGLLIGRPLSGCRRGQLQTYLTALGETWIEDPSNEADHYERVRMRRLIAALEPGRLAAITADAMRLRAAEDITVATYLSSSVRVEATGLIEADIEGLSRSRHLAERCLAILIQSAAGSSRAVPAPAVSELAQTIGDGGPSSRTTLGGAWLQRRGDVLWLGRDPGEAQLSWQDGVWDGRYVAGGESVPEQVPFLLRQSLPDQPAREILSERISAWAKALRLGAVLGALLADQGERA